MRIEQVAAQLYTVRDFMQTPAEIAAGMKKIRQIGYQAVQVSGLGPIAEDELVKILAGEGLTCCSTHEDNAAILAEPQAVVEKLKKIGCTNTAYAYPSLPLDSLADAKEMAAQLNAAGKVFHDAGLFLTYHNHAIEFRRFEGRLVLDVIYEETDPRYLQGEIDTYWVQHGGGDPVAWCEKLKGRLPLLHMKDFKTTGWQPVFAEIGNGNLNWPKIVAAAEASGCQWFIVEQDECDGDPFDSLRQSFEYIKANLVSG